MNKNHNTFPTAILYSMTIFGLLTFAGCGSSTDNATDKSEQAAPKEFSNSKQQDFIKKKSDLFYNSVIKPTNAAVTTMFKEKTEQLTKDFLKANNNILTDWTGTVISIIATDEKGRFYGGDDKAKRILSLMIDCGTIKFDDGEDNYAMTLEQAQMNKARTKGIYPSNPLYYKVINLKEGEKVKLSAKVLKSDEHGIYGPVGKNNRKYENQETGLEVEFTAIEVLPTQQAEQ